MAESVHINEQQQEKDVQQESLLALPVDKSANEQEQAFFQDNRESTKKQAELFPEVNTEQFINKKKETRIDEPETKTTEKPKEKSDSNESVVTEANQPKTTRDSNKKKEDQKKTPLKPVQAFQINKNQKGKDDKEEEKTAEEETPTLAAFQVEQTTGQSPDASIEQIEVNNPSESFDIGNYSSASETSDVDIAPSQTSFEIDQYLDATPSQMAVQSNTIGASVNKALNSDRKATAKATKVKANLDSSTTVPPPPPPDVNKIQSPSLTDWKEPERKVQRTDIPKVDTSGNANPQNVNTQSTQEGAKAVQEQQKAAGEIAGLPGQEQIQGSDLDINHDLELPDTTATPQAKMTPEMKEYLEMPLGSFRSKADDAAKNNWEADISATRSQINESIEKRDAEQAQAISDSHQEANKLEQEAQQQQEQQIAQSRGAIEQEKEKGMARSQAQLDEYQAKAGGEKDRHMAEIENRIEQDEQHAEKKMNDADKKIAEEKKKAEKKKEEEKKKAEEKKKKRSFWQRIGDFFSKIFNALKNLIKKIVNALASLVKKILAAAQKFVNKLIDLARQFIIKAIEIFSKILKKFLSVALAAFPGIRDEVLGAIDQIVNTTIEAIHRAAEFLKESIQGLVNKLNTLIDFIHNFYTALIDGGFAMLQAIITGNFKDLFKIAFMTACNALGLPGEELWSILMKAKDEIFNIIKNPIGFLKNLIKACKTGFLNFMKNILGHLQRGLFGWLFGQMDATGIVLPQRFDLPSIFLFIRQLFGFTFEYVEARIMMHIGEENIEKAKEVIAFFRMLFEQGPGPIWEMFKVRLGNLKQEILAGIQEFIVVQVIQKAVTKLISMLIPGGGFLTAIWGMYQTLMFFLENIQKIAALVNGIMDSLGRITRGMIGEAAIIIENVMVNSLPLIFKFLAKLIGISGIGKRISKIIQKLKTPVNKAIDLTIGKAASTVKTGYGKAKTGAKKGWNKAKESGKKGFKAAKEGGLKAGVKSVKSDAVEAKESAKEEYRAKKEEVKDKLGQGKEKMTGAKKKIIGKPSNIENNEKTPPLEEIYAERTPIKVFQETHHLEYRKMGEEYVLGIASDWEDLNAIHLALRNKGKNISQEWRELWVKLKNINSRKKELNNLYYDALEEYEDEFSGKKRTKRSKDETLRQDQLRDRQLQLNRQLEAIRKEETQAANKFIHQSAEEFSTEVAEILGSKMPALVYDPDVTAADDGKVRYHKGTSGDPIPLTWYKPTQGGNVYKNIKVHDHYQKKDITLQPFTANPLVYSSTNNAYSFGVRSKYQPKINDVLVNSPKHGKSRDEQKRLNNVLSDMNYNLKTNNEDGDHVKDLGFGGDDKIENYWPLDSTINRFAFTGWRKTYLINYKTSDTDSISGDTIIKKAPLNAGNMIGKHFKITAAEATDNPSVNNTSNSGSDTSYGTKEKIAYAAGQSIDEG